MRITRVDRPYRMDGEAAGELAGTGSWRLYEDDDATAVLFEWRVRTTRVVDERARARRAPRLPLEPRPAHARRRPRARAAPRRAAAQRGLNSWFGSVLGSLRHDRRLGVDVHEEAVRAVALVVVHARAEVAVLELHRVGGLEVALHLVRRLGERRSRAPARRCARCRASPRRSAGEPPGPRDSPSVASPSRPRRVRSFSTSARTASGTPFPRRRARAERAGCRARATATIRNRLQNEARIRPGTRSTPR